MNIIVEYLMVAITIIVEYLNGCQTLRPLLQK